MPMTSGLYESDGSLRVSVVSTTTSGGTPALDGTDATGVTPPTGAVGIRGWLSAIYSKLTSATSWSDTARQPVEVPDTKTFSGSLTATGDLFSTDMTGYESVTVQITSAGSATVSFETSNDNSTWVACAGFQPLNVGDGGAAITNAGAARMLMFRRTGRYFRARVSSYTSGTVTHTSVLSKNPIDNITVSYVGGSANLNVVNLGSPVTWTNRSGTITTGGTSQQIAAALSSRRGFWFQNVSDTVMYIQEGGSATAGQPSIMVAANGGYYESPAHGSTTGTLNVTCATTGKAFSCREW